MLGPEHQSDGIACAQFALIGVAVDAAADIEIVEAEDDRIGTQPVDVGAGEGDAIDQRAIEQRRVRADIADELAIAAFGQCIRSDTKGAVIFDAAAVVEAAQIDAGIIAQRDVEAAIGTIGVIAIALGAARECGNAAGAVIATADAAAQRAAGTAEVGAGAQCAPAAALCRCTDR